MRVKVYRDDERAVYVNESASSAASRLVVAVPYKLIPVEGAGEINQKKEVAEVIVKGYIEFFVDILHEEVTTADGKRMVPQLKFSVSTHHNI